MKSLSKLLCAVAATGWLAGCAVSPVKPIYPAEVARLAKVELWVTAPKEALSVEQMVTATTVQPMGPGAYSGAGILGAVIASVVVDMIVNEQAKKNADALRLDLAALSDQVLTVDYSAMVVKHLEGEFASGEGKVSTVLAQKPLGPAEQKDAATVSAADAILFVDVTRAFTNGGPPVRYLPPPAPGMHLGIKASVTMVSRQGEVLLKDTIVFEPPLSAGSTKEERVAWWRENNRYRHLLERSGIALGMALRQQLFGQTGYANEAAFNAQRDADVKEERAAQEQRVLATLRRFRNCDDFYKVPLTQTRFELYRTAAEGPLVVGMTCGAGQSASATARTAP